MRRYILEELEAEQRRRELSKLTDDDLQELISKERVITILGHKLVYIHMEEIILDLDKDKKFKDVSSLEVYKDRHVVTVKFIDKSVRVYERLNDCTWHRVI